MSPRIVKKTEFVSDSYQFGRVVVEKKGLLLRTIEKHRPYVDSEKYVRDMEERITKVGLQFLESKAIDIIEVAKKEMEEVAQVEVERVLAQIDESLVELVLGIAFKLCRQKMTDDKSIIQQLVRDAVSRLGQEKIATIRLHPSESAVVEQIREEVLLSKNGLKELIIEHDPDLEPGGCMVSGETRLIDATVGTRIKEIEHGLKGQYEN